VFLLVLLLRGVGEATGCCSIVVSGASVGAGITFLLAVSSRRGTMPCSFGENTDVARGRAGYQEIMKIGPWEGGKRKGPGPKEEDEFLAVVSSQLVMLLVVLLVVFLVSVAPMSLFVGSKPGE